MKGSFYAMVFHPSERNLVCVRSLRASGFSTLELAKGAITRLKMDGYVKKLGQAQPVWTNVEK